MTEPPQKTEDEQHLDLLGVFHYVVGGLTALGASIPIIHLIIGFAILSGNFGDMQDEPEAARAVGILFIVIALFIIAIGWAIAICIIITGSKLRSRKSYTFCMVIAAIECLNMPIGTILGVFTIVVLSRENVKAMFQQSRPL